MEALPSSSADVAPVRDQAQQTEQAQHEVEPVAAQVHIHLDLDTDAGMLQARTLLGGIFSTLAARPQVAIMPPPPAVNAPHQAAPLAVQPAPAPYAALQAQAPAPQQAALQVQMPQPPAAVPLDLASFMMQLGTPARRRPGRPSRAETELRALLNNASPAAAAPAGNRFLCRVCNQPRADSMLRNCGHTCCRSCVVPFLALRPVCPVNTCARPTSVQDVLSVSL